MNSHYYENSNMFSIKGKNDLINADSSNLELTLNVIDLLHKIFDGLNFSLIILISILSFISINTQRKWTNFYKVRTQTREINANLIDHISKTEEFYLTEIENHDEFRKATSKDLIYLSKPQEITKMKLHDLIFGEIKNGILESKFQRGY